uniref:Tectonic family member 3 n=1 Tax=Anas platyrhynchos platyrhynchos TaxID=8840 RepID=A0A493TLT8_ANAPP
MYFSPINHGIISSFHSLLCKKFLISFLVCSLDILDKTGCALRRSFSLSLCPEDVVTLHLDLLFHSDVVFSFSELSFQAGDPILIYFDSSSTLSMLRQPVKMGVSGLCVDGNPAGFLESKSTSCTRIFTNLSKSCITDPALDAASYYRDFTVLKVCCLLICLICFQVKIIPVTPPRAPYMKDNTCNNAVSEVTYEIEFNGTHGIQSVSVRFKVTNISGNSGVSLQQHFTLHFWVSTRTPSHTLPRSGNPGFIIGAPLLIANTGATQHMSILRSEGDGSCSQFLRHTVQFGKNMRTGCKLSNCSYIQMKLYEALQGMNTAEDLAITSSAHSTQVEERTTILIQNYHLNIYFLYLCVSMLNSVLYFLLQLLDVSLVPLTTVVTFADMTEWPEPPHGQPKIQWKLPFDFFFPFKVVLNGERSYRGDLAAYFLLILILSRLIILESFRLEKTSTIV